MFCLECRSMPFRARTPMCSMVSLKRSSIKPLGPLMSGHSGNLPFVPVTWGPKLSMCMCLRSEEGLRWQVAPLRNSRSELDVADEFFWRVLNRIHRRVSADLIPAAATKTKGWPEMRRSVDESEPLFSKTRTVEASQPVAQFQL